MAEQYPGPGKLVQMSPPWKYGPGKVIATPRSKKGKRLGLHGLVLVKWPRRAKPARHNPRWLTVVKKGHTHHA